MLAHLEFGRMVPLIGSTFNLPVCPSELKLASMNVNW